MHEDIYDIQSHALGTGALTFELAGISYCDGSYRIWRPRSSVACIEFILKGKGTIQIDGQTRHPEAGDCYFLHMGKDQLYFSDAEDPWVKVWVNVSGKLLDDLIGAYGLRGAYYFPDFSAGALLEDLLLMVKERRADLELKGTLLIHELLYEMGVFVAEKRSVNPLAQTLKQYMDEHVRETLSVTTLASLVERSESQVIRIFRESYGQTPYAYFLALKIDLAKRLLTGSHMSVRAIAEHLGFADEFYFSNVFKKHTTLAPQHYRMS